MKHLLCIVHLNVERSRRAFSVPQGVRKILRVAQVQCSEVYKGCNKGRGAVQKKLLFMETEGIDPVIFYIILCVTVSRTTMTHVKMQ